VPMAPAGTNQRRYLKACRAPWLPIARTRRLRYSAVFQAALRTSQCLPIYGIIGYAGDKEQRELPAFVL
jgi:hypothetical protein